MTQEITIDEIIKLYSEAIEAGSMKIIVGDLWGNFPNSSEQIWMNLIAEALRIAAKAIELDIKNKRLQKLLDDLRRG